MTAKLYRIGICHRTESAYEVFVHYRSGAAWPVCYSRGNSGFATGVFTERIIRLISADPVARSEQRWAVSALGAFVRKQWVADVPRFPFPTNG